MIACFIVEKESKYRKDCNDFLQKLTNQREFINKFFKDNGIEANKYVISGNGFFNCKFSEKEKRKIRLGIIPTDKDKEAFNKILCKPKDDGLCFFKKASNLAKKFQDECIKNEVIINLWEPRVADYFESLGVWGCSYQRFMLNDELYIKVDSEHLQKNDIPQGFKPIKTSEYYKAFEDFESKN